MEHASFLFLGTGGSAGVPLIGCKCPVCTSTDPHNQRLRPSGLLKIGGKRLLIDSGPDFRYQAIRHYIDELDGVILTHTHFDHVGGLDELRTYYLVHRSILPVLVSLDTLEDLKKRYDYLFGEKSQGVSLAAQLHFQVLEEERGETEFLGVPLRYVTYEQGNMRVNGFRFGKFAYISDIKRYPDTIFHDLEGVEILVMSALKETPSQMHLSFEEAIHFARRIEAKEVYFTHISHETEHITVSKTLPEGFQLGYDGLTINW